MNQPATTLSEEAAARYEARKQQILADRAANRVMLINELTRAIVHRVPSVTAGSIAEAIIDGDIPGVSFDEQEFNES